MGSPSMNLIPARIERANGGLHLKVGEGQKAIDLALPPKPAAVDRYVGKTVLAGLRPEAIGVENERAASALRTVPVTISVLEPTGPDTLAVLDLGGMEVSARLGADMPHVSGEQCELRVDLSKLVLFDADTEVRIH
jgi:multiple sugar transport system ATP-binding protein